LGEANKNTDLLEIVFEELDVKALVRINPHHIEG
jgi:hypothetical protein